MKGHVARKGDVWYVVIYEGVDPITGKERRRCGQRDRRGWARSWRGCVERPPTDVAA